MASVLDQLPRLPSGSVSTVKPIEDVELRSLRGNTARRGAASSIVENEQREDANPAVTVTKEMKLKGYLHMAALCWTMFHIGWNDGTPGPMLPRLQEVYHVNFAIVSMIFVSNAAGVIAGGILNIYLNGKLGFGKIIVLGSVSSIVAFCIQAPAPPFPVFVASYAIAGFGATLQDIHANGYIASLQKSSSKLGVLHCVYGIGAFAAPLVSTQFARLPRWSFLYLASMAIALINVAILVSVFRLKRQEDCIAETGEVHTEDQVVGTHSQRNAYVQIVRMKTLHLIALFILAYVGVEVTIGGWMVTYTIDVRGGGPSSGYISSGFFGGLALGRVLLLQVTKKLGNRKAVLGYMLLAIGLQLVVWLVPNLISGAVAVSLIGVIFGPIYPIVINEASKILPRSLLTPSISWIATWGTAGSAGLPFIAGLLSQEKGVWALQPLLVSMMALMVGVWVVIPKTRARSE